MFHGRQEFCSAAPPNVRGGLDNLNGVELALLFRFAGGPTMGQDGDSVGPCSSVGYEQRFPKPFTHTPPPRWRLDWGRGNRAVKWTAIWVACFNGGLCLGWAIQGHWRPTAVMAAMVAGWVYLARAAVLAETGAAK